jgi:hypothetical protein
LNVEFAFAIVLAKKIGALLFSDVNFLVKLNAMEINAGMYINNRKPTANKQVEMSFKLTGDIEDVGDVECSRRTFRQIMNNL